jgi:hypothetical protein
VGIRVPLSRETGPTSFDAIRDRVAARSARQEAVSPAAVDLEAEIVDAQHTALTGVASQTSGPHSPDYWREVLLGGKPETLADVCRLAKAHTREEREAARVTVAILQREVEAARRNVRSLEVEASQASLSASQLSLAVSEALEDGAIDSHEIGQLRLHIQRAKAELADVEAALAR